MEKRPGKRGSTAIARAMANDPPILIGDEMTGDLDSATGFEIMSLIEKLNHERGTTVVYVTHDPRMSKYAHRTIQLRDGKISADNGNGNGNGYSIAMPIALPAELVIDDDGKLIVDRK